MTKPGINMEGSEEVFAQVILAFAILRLQSSTVISSKVCQSFLRSLDAYFVSVKYQSYEGSLLNSWTW